jgi:Domain of unknown function (DUF4340)
MRLNRGTLILLLASLVVIAVVLILSNNQASAPGAETTTPSAFSTAAAVGPLLPDLDQAAIASVEITNNQAGSSTVLTKNGTGIWTIASATYSSDRETDQAAAAEAITSLVALQANDSFESDKLSDFGLDNPAHVITITNADGTQYVIYVGNKNPAGNRNYVLVTTQEGVEITPVPDSTAEATAEATSEATAETTSEAAEISAEATAEATSEPYRGVTPGITSGTVYLVLQSSVNAVTDLISSPPYVPAPTPTLTPTVTLNPLSEVEQATQTAEFFASVTAIFDQVAMTQTAEATAEATPELTDTPTSD